MLTKFDKLPSIQVGADKLELELGELSARSKEVALKELRETPEVRTQAVAELRKLLEAEKDLYCPIDNEEWLVRFLRASKFYPESARDMIKNYYAFRLKYADVCDGLTPSKEANIFKQDLVTSFINRDQFGRRFLLVDEGVNWNYKEISLDETFKANTILMEAFVMEPETQVNGVVGIYDLNGMTLKHTMRFTPALLKRTAESFQDFVPLRIKTIHIINQPKVFDVVYALFKGFLNKKIKSRVYFHGTDMSSLHKHIAPECLPPKYGGTAENAWVHSSHWHELFVQYEKEFEALNTYGYNKK